MPNDPQIENERNASWQELGSWNIIQQKKPKQTVKAQTKAPLKMNDKIQPLINPSTPKETK